MAGGGEDRQNASLENLRENPRLAEGHRRAIRSLSFITKRLVLFENSQRVLVCETRGTVNS